MRISLTTLCAGLAILFSASGCELLNMLDKAEEAAADFEDSFSDEDIDELTSTEVDEDFDPTDADAEINNCGEACLRIDACYGFDGDAEVFGSDVDECLEGCASMRAEIAAKDEAEREEDVDFAGDDAGEFEEFDEPDEFEDPAQVLRSVVGCVERAGCDAEGIEACTSLIDDSANGDDDDEVEAPDDGEESDEEEGAE